MSTPSKVNVPGGALYMAGANLSSGSIQTGEMTFVRCGGRAFSIFSGALFSGTSIGVAGQGIYLLNNTGEALLYSGAGRLNSILLHTQMQSGLAAFFYDSAAPVSGGPAASGLNAKIVGIIPPTFSPAQVSGNAPWSFQGATNNLDIPFQSGLCVSLKSGVPGFTITINTEVDYQGVGSGWTSGQAFAGL
jgi:hypothetical protein